MKRPLKNRRVLGPLFDFRSTNSQEDIGDGVSDGEVEFTSLDDLPDSPMLMQYIEREAEYLEVDEEEIINSRPVKQYMKRLGVWEQAKRKNS